MRILAIRALSVLFLMLAVVWFLVDRGFEPVLTAIAGLVGLFSAEFVKAGKREGSHGELRVVGLPERSESGEAGTKSIVVLPFDNMSPDPSDRYFCDGLTDEITTNLSYLRSLRVISRTSAVMLKGTRTDVRAIREKLNVQYVLEGSVRKAGDALRITAQLIQADSDSHLWAERFDGVLDDVFKIQEQVARSIVSALEIELKPSEDYRLGLRPFGDLNAYDCYLKARYETWLFTGESFARALNLLKRGEEIIGEHDLLLAAKANINFQLVNGMMSPPESFGHLLNEAETWGRRAIELNPNSAQAYEALCLVCFAKGDPLGGVQNATKALELDSDMAFALMMAGYFRAMVGWDLPGARRLFQRLSGVDPLNPINKGALAWLYWYEGDFEGVVGAWQDWQRLLEELRSPYLVMMAYFQAGAGNLDEGMRLVALLEQGLPDHPLTQLGTFLKHSWLGEREQALRAVTPELEEAARWDDLWPLYLAGGYAQVRANEEAFYWLDRAIEYGVCNVSYLRDYDRFLDNLRTDKRFQQLMEKAETRSKDLSGAFRASIRT